MAEKNQQIIEWQDLGVVGYREAWDLQEELRRERIDGNIQNRLLLLEHPSVFTMGRRECEADILSPEHLIEADGIEIVKTNRGGRITYHGPGQLVGYFICELGSLGLGVKEFVNRIEEIVIRTVAEIGVKSNRDGEHPGVWVGQDKLAAIGLHVSHDVTQHGFALNGSCDLSAYKHILACGISGRGVTRISDHSSANCSTGALKKAIVRNAEDVLNQKMIEIV
jgi:lipoyl(octanoyl) transferase